MAGLDELCAALAILISSSVILNRRLGCTYSNFKSNRRRRRSSKFAWPNSNTEGLSLENGNENYGGQTTTEKAYQRAAGISTERTMVSLLLLIATVVAARLTYQAGLNPPAGSFWQEDSYDKIRTSVFYTAVVIASTSCFILVPHLVKIVSSVWFFNHCNSNARRHNTMRNWHEPVDREKSICTHSRESDPAAAGEEEDSSNPKPSCWNLASAAVHHMTGSLALLATGGYSPMNSDEVVHDASTGRSLRVLGRGSLRTKTMVLDDVWYVPGLGSNVVSTGQLARHGCAITLGPRGCRITRGDALVGTARFVDGHRFELDFLKAGSCPGYL